MEKAPHKSQKKNYQLAFIVFVGIFSALFFINIYFDALFVYMQYIVVVAAARIATGKMGKTTAIL